MNEAGPRERLIRRLLNAPGKWVTSSLALAARFSGARRKVNYTPQAAGPGGKGGGGAAVGRMQQRVGMEDGGEGFSSPMWRRRSGAG